MSKEIFKAQCDSLADAIESNKSNMFATFESIEQLIVSQQIKGESVAHIFMAVNTVLQMVADEVRDTSK